MSGLREALTSYLSLRRGMGFKLDRDEKLLGQFITYLEQRGSGTVTVADALAWATLPAGASPGWLRMRITVVRGVTLSLREREFVDAARAIGASNRRIIARHVVPNCAGPIIVNATLVVAEAILLESTLSFLGLGIQPPTPSWGNMLKDAPAEMDKAPWVAIFPGLAIFLAVVSINFIGDGLRDALDPRHVVRRA